MVRGINKTIKLISISSLFFILGLCAQGNPKNEFIQLKDDLVEFEESQLVVFLFSEKNLKLFKSKEITQDEIYSKILRDFPILNKNNQEKEIFYFYSFLQYKKKLKKLLKIKERILSSKLLSDDYVEYLLTYCNLLIINIWLNLKNRQERDPGKEILKIIEDQAPPSPNNKLNRKYLSELYTFYAEINIALAKMKLNVFARLLNKTSRDFENEIYLRKAINLDGNNYRALLRYALITISLKQDYFFLFRVIRYLEKIIQKEKNKNSLFFAHLVLSNIFYVKNNLFKSWEHLQKAKIILPPNPFIKKIENNFKNREKVLIKL